MAAGAAIYISEVADYEVRRELVRLVRAGQLPPSRLVRLDQLTTLCMYLPVSTAMWKRAADLWADARQQGLPTAGATTLDADVLVAAQAKEVGATVVTNNPMHISRWAPVHAWPSFSRHLHASPGKSSVYPVLNQPVDAQRRL